MDRRSIHRVAYVTLIDNSSTDTDREVQIYYRRINEAKSMALDT